MKVFVATSLLVLVTSASLAQETSSYSLEKTADGYVRMDKSTGAMSICKEQGDQLVCRIAADDRDVLEDGTIQIEKRLKSLEDRLATLETLGAGAKDALPTDEEFEKTMGYMEKFFRRFMGVVKDLNVDESPLNKT